MYMTELGEVGSCRSSGACLSLFEVEEHQHSAFYTTATGVRSRVNAKPLLIVPSTCTSAAFSDDTDDAG